MARAALLRSRPVVAGIVIVVLGCCVPLVGSGYVLGLLTVAFYTAVFAMAWDLLFGFAGEVNFGPTFLIAMGEALRPLGELATLLVSLLALVVVLFFPDGFLGMLQGRSRRD